MVVGVRSALDESRIDEGGEQSTGAAGFADKELTDLSKPRSTDELGDTGASGLSG